MHLLGKPPSFFFRLLLCTLVWILATAKRSSAPDASSTALRLHKLYTLQPPHDMEMYSILQISPNATAAQITQSYRKLSRKYHPDKAARLSSPEAKQQQRQNLEQVQGAYEILKDDSTRLLYHKYGISEPVVAVTLLMGPHRPQHLASLDRAHFELLQLMGHDGSNNVNLAKMDEEELTAFREERRVRTIAAHLVELLRPIVEGTADRQLVAHHFAQDCDRWKKLPMGAQIIRCIGRAYRHSGQDFLKRQHLSTPVRQKWRKAKGLWTAVWASGRATVTEKVWEQQERKFQKSKEKNKDRLIEYHGALDELDDLWHDSEDESDVHLDLDSHEQVRRIEQIKAKQTQLQALQVEALWQITKIDLDKTIRKACDRILSGEYFFFPAHQSPNANEWSQGGNGWVGSSGRVIHADQARLDAANALVFLGNVMVQRSKEGTAWKE